MFRMFATIVLLSGIVVTQATDHYASLQYKSEPTPYNYNYGVIDAYTGTDFAHNEDSDGKNVKGSFTVQLPDGRRQTVDYVANDFSGYTANVRYSGKAEYPSKYGAAITFKPNSYVPVYH